MQSDPTTVRGWLETLTLENAPDWSVCARLDEPCGTLQQAVSTIALHIKGITPKRYWNGACDRIYCCDEKVSQRLAYHAGYNAMSDYLQRQKAGIVPEVSYCPKCENTLPTECFSGETSLCNDCVADEVADGKWEIVHQTKENRLDGLESQNLETKSFSGGPKEWKEFSASLELPKTLDDQEVQYIPVVPSDYARMYERDLKWDEMRKEIQRLQDNLADLLKRL